MRSSFEGFVLLNDFFGFYWRQFFLYLILIQAPCLKKLFGIILRIAYVKRLFCLFQSFFMRHGKRKIWPPCPLRGGVVEKNQVRGPIEELELFLYLFCLFLSYKRFCRLAHLSYPKQSDVLQ